MPRPPSPPAREDQYPILVIFLGDALSFSIHINFGEYPKSVSTKERLA